MAKTVLVFAPHPDDAEFHAGGTLLRFVEEGARVVIVIISDGSKGSFSLAGEDLAAVRYEEAHRACLSLGVEPPVMLDLTDFELDLLPRGYLRERLIYYIRLYHPDVLVSEDPYNLDEAHPDHRAVAWAAYEAVNFSYLTAVHPDHFDEGLQPHYVTEKYFYTQNPRRVNEVVDIEATFEGKIKALLEHKSQIAFLMEDIFRQAGMAGINFQNKIGPEATDPTAIFRWGMRRQASEAGRAVGLALAETFHYERFNPLIESALKQPDREPY
ncbi:MAG: PIG-L family deacetylase [Anaerolineae bacterium]|nr:PIG-L family deacetylase [Anaerolineae bacterium]